MPSLSMVQLNLNQQQEEADKEELINLHKRGDWRGVLGMYVRGYHDPKLLWPRPSEGLLRFIEATVRGKGLQRVVSIGCGCGLLEWLLASATGLEVVGVEVDRDWWTSSYAPPCFLPLHYSDEEAGDAVAYASDSALLFCYFNCAPAWHAYLASYQGPLVLVCGPVEGSGTHSDPQPFKPLTPEWTVSGSQVLGESKDCIVAYTRL